MILSLGLNSQLSKRFNQIIKKNNTILSSKQLDLRKINKIFSKLKNYKPEVVINFMSYNDLELAEFSKENDIINHLAIYEISKYCSYLNIPLIHISTDNVYKSSKLSVDENSKLLPINKYAISKLNGEKAIQALCKKYFIIRTSWLYSGYFDNNNFLISILKKLHQVPDIMYGVTDHISSPTNCSTIANFIKIIIKNNLNRKNIYGIYNCSDQGICSKYELIQEIIKNYNNCNLKNIKMKKVKQKFFSNTLRPKNININLSKTQNTFKFFPLSWKKSLYKEMIDIDNFQYE